VGNAKTDSSMRTIPLNDAAVILCQKKQVHDPNAYVLTGVADRFLEPRMVQYRLAKYTADCRLEGVHFHTLRHTFATRCVEVGFDIKSLSEILGHASPKVTLERYIHASMELKRTNMEKLAAVGL
jgi:integrase